MRNRLVGAPVPLLLHNPLSPGDVLVMTAAIESLHRQYPGHFLTSVRTSVNALFENNPLICNPQSDSILIDMKYPLINKSSTRPVHFLDGYTKFLGKKLGIALDCMVNRPFVYLSEAERTKISRIDALTMKRTPYWIVNAGYKSDITAKNWGISRYQAVIDALRGEVQFVQVGQLSSDHTHEPLQGVIDLRGQTPIRELIRLVYHCNGVLCCTTFLMHLAAALQKPAVIIAGGREPRSWNTYPKQTLFSTIGMLSCCRDRACWKSRTVPLGDGHKNDRSICTQPSAGPDPVPHCMEIIKPSSVVESIRNYNP